MPVKGHTGRAGNTRSVARFLVYLLRTYQRYISPFIQRNTNIQCRFPLYVPTTLFLLLLNMVLFTGSKKLSTDFNDVGLRTEIVA